MRHSAIKRITLLLSLLMAVITMSASPVLRQLKISVELHDNGDADITELRQMSIDDEGTEGYIVIGNLAGSQLKNFSVSDETTDLYTNEGMSWDVKRSRRQKAGRCGIVDKGDGYELCWGLGNSGERIYQIKYTVTNLVRSYEESDGFNWMFIARDMTPSPQKASVTITTPDHEGGLPEDTIKAWAFGFGGEVELVDEGVYVYTTQPMESENSMIVMVELPKGILHPTLSEGKTFEDAINEAFEGSDYEETWYQSLWNEVKHDTEMLWGLLFTFLIFGGAGWFGIKTRRERKKMLKTVNWYREIPVNGDLLQAKKLYNAFYAGGGIKDEDLISALILRFIRTGTLTIENRYVPPTGLKKMMGGEGKMQDCIVIQEFNDRNRLLQSPPQRLLYDMMRNASGEDLVLQPNELSRWMKRHEDDVMTFMKSLKDNISMKQAKKTIDDVRKVYGLKMFLNDFTLANERHLTEVALWNDYLVYATLFGIADQVKADMKQINPEYLKMSQITRNLTDERVVPLLAATTYKTASSIKSSVESRSSGRGGSSSFGGGGGFHGGGSGGGVR